MATVSSGTGSATPPVGPLEDAILDALRDCVETWGLAKVTVDDVCTRAGVSRATLYRVFPGGRDVMFEALRQRELRQFFAIVRAHVDAAENLEDLLVRTIVVSATELARDEELASMLAAEPGETLGQLTVDGVPRIVGVATEFFTPLASRFVDVHTAADIAEIVTRLVISNFLAPSARFDFTDEESTRRLIRTFLPALVEDAGRNR